MSENRINSTLYVLLTSIILLTLFSFLTPENIFTAFSLKKIDYISPVLREKPVTNFPEHILQMPVRAAKFERTIPKPQGLVTIEDYSGDARSLEMVMDQLYRVKSSGGSLRIAFFGDSFIEGDILTMDLRDSLQRYFGGKGIGFLPVKSEVSMFRRSLPSESRDFSEVSLTDKGSKSDVGISGSVFTPGKNAELKIYPPRKVNQVRLIYKNSGDYVSLNKTINNEKVLDDSLAKSEGITSLVLTADTQTIHHFKFKIEGNSNVKIYGIDVSNNNGVYLDNFSMRGNSGLGLKQIPDSQYVQFQKLMKYKLVVLQFGLNTADVNQKDFSNYEKAMIRTVESLKALFPETAFLLLSCSDRSYKQNGNFVTMPSIPLLVEAQRRIAQQTNILFWNMYEGMGGENSMVDLVNNKKANKDYTHLNFSGGQFVADKLYKALMYEYKNYETNKSNEKRLAVR